MKQIYIEFYERIGKVTFYTVRFEGNRESETEAFGHSYEDEFPEDLSIILSWLILLGEKKAQEKFFRDEKNVYAGPTEPCKLRLYCIRCNAHIVILGGGGLKKGPKTQDGAETKKAMELMMCVDKALIEMIRAGQIYYSDDFTMLKGNLSIEI